LNLTKSSQRLALRSITGATLMSLMLTSAIALAHGEEVISGHILRPVTVRFHVQGLNEKWRQGAKTSATFTLSHAYLASFSLNLVPCLVQKNPPITPTSLASTIAHNFFSALVPQAQANHGVRFDSPTQIPLMIANDLTEDATHIVGEFMLPVGRYCEINYTMAHLGKSATIPAEPSFNQYSIYLAGNKKVDDTQQDPLPHTAFELSARYAYGQNVPVNFTISEPSTSPSKTWLDVTLKPEAAFASINIEQAPNLIVRKLLLALPKQLSVKLTVN
jgi:hypothetical protein